MGSMWKCTSRYVILIEQHAKLIMMIMFQTEIVKRISLIIGQVLPFLSQEHQQQVTSAVERAKQVTMSDLNSAIGAAGAAGAAGVRYQLFN